MHKNVFHLGTLSGETIQQFPTLSPLGQLKKVRFLLLARPGANLSFNQISLGNP